MKRSVGRIVKQGATVVLTLAIVVASVLWLSNFFGEKIPAEAPATPAARPAPAPLNGPLHTVQLETVPQYRTAVGTVQAAHAAEIGSRLMAQVKAVHVTAGQEVAADALLVELDDTDLKAKVMQAEAALVRAKALAEQAQRDLEKQEGLFQSGASSRQELLRYQTAHKEAQAAVLQAEHALQEARTVLSWTILRSPISGVVVDKLVEAGDLVRPGQTLVRIYDNQTMQLVASVPEQLTSRLRTGQEVPVKLDVVDVACHGKVSEIVPEAASQSRTFQVKVVGPCPKGVYPGMFGRLLIPMEEIGQIRIPRAAVRSYGQLRQVLVLNGQRQERRFVQVGEVVGDQVVVLSGLRPGETIVATYGQAES